MSEEKAFLPLNIALDKANDFILFLNRHLQISRIELVGQLRRRDELISSIDILFDIDDAQALFELIQTSQFITETISSSVDSLTAITIEGIELNIFLTSADYFAYEKFIRTASEAFLEDFFSDNSIRREDCLGMDEEAIFDMAQMSYLPATFWENYLKCKQYQANACDNDKIVFLDDVQADLHVHSTYSDGRNSIALLADRAHKMGYSYLGISDHSQSLTVARGLSIAKLKEKARAIKKINKEYRDFTVLCGVEVDILADGSLDYPDEVLAGSDYVIGSVHVDTKMSYEEMTQRILLAANSGKIDILGHPTGRMFGIRQSLDFDIEAVMRACAQKKVAMEISGYTKRLDLNDKLAIKAKSMGCVFALGTDAHYIDNLESMKYAVWMSQRAWLNKSDIVNCRDLDGFLNFIKERREIYGKK